jgi:N-acetylneuraminate epimerase
MSYSSRHSTRLLGGQLLACFLAADGLAGGAVPAVPEGGWKPLPPIPDREGFAGAFSGVSNGSLVVAGGANFPDKRPWENGTKVWHDGVFALDRADGKWRLAGKLPRPLGYGVSATTQDGIVCAGGSDEAGHHAEVFLLKLQDGKVAAEPLPALPRPCANMCGAVVNGMLYVAGGIESPGATTAMHTFWSLELEHPEKGWRELAPWPGPARMLATAASDGESFFLFGGAGLHPGADGRPARDWLRDAYRYNPEEGWRRIADLPRVSVAAPSPAPVVRRSSADGGAWILLIGGDDGAQAEDPPARHRGFPCELFAYDTHSDAWTEAGRAPFSLVTTSAVDWDGLFVIPGGEARPGVRSTEAWSFRPQTEDAP